MINFPTQILDCDSHSPDLSGIFLSSDASICSTMTFPPLRNSDYVVFSVSTDSPSYSQRDSPFHHIAYNHSRTDWDGFRDHLRDVPWEDIFNTVPLLLLVSGHQGIVACDAAIVHRNHSFFVPKG